MNRVCVIDVPGLSRDLLRHVPSDSAFGKWMGTQTVSDLRPTWPAVTCSVQASLTTGTTPSEHGIIANGIATFRSESDREKIDASNFASYRRNVSFWEQSNQFLDRKRFWQDENGVSRYKTALLFFQNSMPGFAGTPRPAADIVLTPKPDHGPDGKLTNLCWSEPRELVSKLFAEFGPFPLMNYWGPMAGIASSQWIAKAAAWVWRNEKPTLQLTYVPHLDYDLQRFGPNSPQAAKAIVDLCGALEPLFEAIGDAKIVLLSEYSIHPVSRSVQPNRLLREAGLLRLNGSEIDYERSTAFAMVDHQIGHLFSQDETAWPLLVAAGLMEVPISLRPTHTRAGQKCFESAADSWLDYRWWSTESEAPSYASQVDIHRKPGYDPLELFVDFKTRRIATEADKIHGSHGRVDTSPGVLIGLGDVGGIEWVAASLQKLLAD